MTGIIAIPGMMSGAILGGADVQQAARLQMIIMFMIAASSALACIVATLLALSVCIDSEHRIRSERIKRCHGDVASAVRCVWIRIASSWKHHRAFDGSSNGSSGERTPLLG